jgi:hypothetical protein
LVGGQPEVQGFLIAFQSYLLVLRCTVEEPQPAIIMEMVSAHHDPVGRTCAKR